MENNNATKPLVESVDAGPTTLVSIQVPNLTDAQIIAAVTSETRAISRQSELPNILLDFHLVQHISLDFLDAMRGVAEEIEMRGGTICCCSLSEEMRAILQIMGVNVSYAGNHPKRALARCMANLRKSR